MGGGNKWDKAYFIRLDKDFNEEGGPFHVQFNPKELKLDESASWKDSDEFHQDKPLITYIRGKASTLSMELIFDTTDTPNTDVHTEWVEGLRAYLSCTATDDGKGSQGVKRPPYVKFGWKDFSMVGVVEKLGVTFLMFRADGTPLRAKCSVTMKEVKDTEFDTRAKNVVQLTDPTGMLNSSATAQTYELSEGETLTQAAERTGSDYKALGEANNIADPMNPEQKKIVIPSDKQAATIFAGHKMSEAPANWADLEKKLSPFSKADDWDTGLSTFEFGLTPAENIAFFSSGDGEGPEAGVAEIGESDLADGWRVDLGETDHAYGEDNEASFSDTKSGDVEMSEFEFGESQGADGWSTDASEFGHAAAEEESWDAPPEYEGEAVEKSEFSFGDSQSTEGDTSKSEFSFGDSESTEGDTSRSEFGGREAAAENEASFSDTKSGDVEKSEFQVGDSESTEGDTSRSEFGGKEAAAENEASFSGTKSGDVEAGSAEIGDSETTVGDTSRSEFGGKEAAAENEASFSDTKSGDVEAGSAEIGDSSKADTMGDGGRDSAAGRHKADDAPGAGDSAVTRAERDVDQGVAEGESAAREIDEAVDSPRDAHNRMKDKVETIQAKAKMHADRISGKDTEATD